MFVAHFSSSFCYYLEFQKELELLNGNVCSSECLLCRNKLNVSERYSLLKDVGDPSSRHSLSYKPGVLFSQKFKLHSY